MTMMDLRSQHVSLSQRVYETLVDIMLSQQFEPGRLHFEPGQRLFIDEIARALGVSETPVKQALIRLAAEGTVEFKSGKGPYLAHLSRSDVLDLVDARLMCELYALSRGKDALTDEFLAGLQRVQAEFEQIAQAAMAGDVSVYRPYILKDKEFHSYLVSLGGNQVIQNWSASLNDHMRVHIGIRVPEWRPGPATVNEHRAIVAALVEREWHAAEQAVRAHLMNIRERLLHRVQSEEHRQD